MINHPDRVVLHNEVHARPRPSVVAPHRVSHVALLRPRDSEDPPAALLRLCVDHRLSPPAPGQRHFFGDFSTFRMKWERHGEFDDYTVYRAGVDPERPFADPAIEALPRGWLETLPGETIAAVHVSVLTDEPRWQDGDAPASALESTEVLGARIGDGAGAAYTDLRLGTDGFSRFLLLDRSLTIRQTGREVQRLIELEVYRLMAMLGFAQARVVAAELDPVEHALAALVARLESAAVEDEPVLLREVTHLAATVERLSATSSFRFAASRAYQALVWQRGSELREERLPGVQTITGFLSRRFGPAMAFCESVSGRLQSSAERVSRASGLLRTRVEIERERQNQQMLAAMNRRAQLQLRLQQTVEGLSVAAITYYATGLVGYLFKGAKGAGMAINADLATALAVIPIALIVALGVRHIRHSIRRRLLQGPTNAID
jgi:uncharacterized membrane-anchored protein